jgi:hypothetical protein
MRKSRTHTLSASDTDHFNSTVVIDCSFDDTSASVAVCTDTFHESGETKVFTTTYSGTQSPPPFVPVTLTSSLAPATVSVVEYTVGPDGAAATGTQKSGASVVRMTATITPTPF